MVGELEKMCTKNMVPKIWAAHGWEGGKKASLPKICHTYPRMMKRGTVIPYPKKIQKVYDSRVTPLEFC